MPLVLTKLERAGLPIFCRENTSDESTVVEVFDKRCYVRKKIGFDVAPGEFWLDLGANIGAFSVYCHSKGARVESYEPDASSFKMLSKNSGEFATLHNAAVTNKVEPQLEFFMEKAKSPYHHGTILSRGTFVPQKKTEPVLVRNVQAKTLRSHYDGVKMDIEGSEGGIIDDHQVPECDKLVLEYHTSRDPNMDNLARRLLILRSLFRTLSYTPELDKISARGGEFKTRFDRLIFCMGRKK